jgi:hypothetical protein
VRLKKTKMAITFFVMAPKILLGIAVPIRHHPPVFIVWLPQFGYQQIVRPPLSQVIYSLGAALWLEMAVQDTHRPESTRLTQ